MLSVVEAAKAVCPPLEGRLKIVVRVLLAIAWQGWFLYRPFVDGWLPGIYGFAQIYGAVGAIPTGIAWIVFVTFAPLFFGVVLGVCLLGLWRGRQRYWQRLVRVILLILLIFGAFAPTLKELSAGPSVTIEPWNRLYRTAYSSWPIDMNYGQFLVMECDRTGQLCRTAYKDNFGFDGLLKSLSVSYSSETDRLTIADDEKFHVHHVHTKDKILYPPQTTSRGTKDSWSRGQPCPNL